MWQQALRSAVGDLQEFRNDALREVSQGVQQVLPQPVSCGSPPRPHPLCCPSLAPMLLVLAPVTVLWQRRAESWLSRRRRRPGRLPAKQGPMRGSPSQASLHLLTGECTDASRKSACIIGQRLTACHSLLSMCEQLCLVI